MLITRRTLGWLALVVVTCVVDAPPTASQEMKAEPRGSSTLAKGRQLLASNCAACHGIDGKGSERAPNIANSPDVLRLSDAQLTGIITNGIPGTGMPAFHSLSNPEVRQLISYLHSLEGTPNNTKLPGDPGKGEAIFFGQAGCSNCHMIAGRGGFIGSDLTDYARTHSAEQMRDAITESNSSGKQLVRLVTVSLRDGEKYVGIVRNEDNFSLQLQGLDGTFHFIMKADMQKVEYDSKPLMPDNFGSSLTAKELDDLVSYLLKAAGNTNPQKRANDNGMDNLEE
jgi:cytochrome c oxidase cbb3-type subunit III